MDDIILNKCIQQGYVPRDCKLSGAMVFLLIQDGKIPCIGCNAVCPHRDINLNSETNAAVNEELNYITKENLEYRERIRKRKELGTNSKVTVYVDTDYDGALLTAINIDSERGYFRRCRNGVVETVYSIIAMCNHYHANQVIISLNGLGKNIYDCLKDKNLDNIDIVPIGCMSARL